MIVQFPIAAVAGRIADERAPVPVVVEQRPGLDALFVASRKPRFQPLLDATLQFRRAGMLHLLGDRDQRRLLAQAISLPSKCPSAASSPARPGPDIFSGPSARTGPHPAAPAARPGKLTRVANLEPASNFIWPRTELYCPSSSWPSLRYRHWCGYKAHSVPGSAPSYGFVVTANCVTTAPLAASYCHETCGVVHMGIGVSSKEV